MKTRVEILELKSLKEFPGNPQELSTEHIAVITDNMRRRGWYGEWPLIAYFEDIPYIVSGNHRVICAIKAGIVEHECIVIDDSEYTWEQACKDNIMFNTLHGEPDPGKLSDFMQNIIDEYDLSIEEISKDVGLNEEEIAQILDTRIEIDSEKDDVVPEVKEVKSKAGDIYELNSHRILCGDSTDSRCIDKLMIYGCKADIVFSDPPYNIDLDYKTYEDNKNEIEYYNFCKNWFENLQKVCDSIIITPGKQNIKMWYSIANIKDFGIWLKKNAKTGGKIFNLLVTEPILFIGKFKKNKRSNDLFEHFVWSGFLRDCAEASTGTDHPCPKPFPLIQDIIENYSNSSNLVLDIFLGSGTTLIVCEKKSRICYGIEIDPFYIDVTVQRYINYTNSTDNCYLIRDNEKIPIKDIGFKI